MGMLVFAAWKSLSSEGWDPFEAESAACELMDVGSKEEKIRMESLGWKRTPRLLSPTFHQTI